MTRPFHYSFKVRDLEEARQFYSKVLGCSEGRSTATWVDFDFYGNQLSLHLSDRFEALDYCGEVDGIEVPIPHFGAIVSVDQFEALRERLEDAGVTFVVKPYLRYAGNEGQQHTLFILDPSGNPIEFKAFVDEGEIFTG